MEGYQKIERMSVPEQVFEQLKQAILSGKWQPGDGLPSESQLASEFGVSRMSVRTAIKKLETFGIVEVRRGEGTYVIEFDPAVFLKGLSPIFSKPKNAIEILEFRKALETECLKLAIVRADKKDIETLGGVFDQYWQALRAEDYGKAVEYDYCYHRLVFLMSKNSLFTQIYESMSDLFFINIDDNERLTVRSHDTSRPDLDAHSQIVEALRRRDMQGAVNAYTGMIKEILKAYRTIGPNDAGAGKRRE